MQCTCCSAQNGWLSGKTNSFLNEGLIPWINVGGAAVRPVLRGARRPGAHMPTGSSEDLPGSKGKLEQVKKILKHLLQEW